MGRAWPSRSASALVVTLASTFTLCGSALTSASTASAAAPGEPVVCAAGDVPPEKRARVVFDQAVQLEASEPERALALYQCAASLADRAVIELRIGVVAERLQQLDVAIAAFERYLSLAGRAAPDVDKMRQHVGELRAANAKRASDARNAAIATAGPPAAAPTEPPPEAERSRAPLCVGWGLVAGAAVLGAVGAGMLVDARSKSDDVQALPMGTTWSSDEARGTYDAAKRSQTIGIVCLALVPALLITGGILIASGGSRRGTASALRADSSPALSF